MADQSTPIMAYRKHNKNLRLILLLFILCGLLNGSQGQSMDSLVSKYTDKQGMVNIDSLLVAGRRYFYSASNKALEIGHRSVFFAEKQGDQLKLADCYRFLGACYVDFKNDYDSAHYYYGRAESLYQSLNSIEASNGEGAVLHNYGVIQHYLGDYLKSIEYYTKA